MIPNHCRVKHDPPHSYGDCVRAAVASMLNKNTTEAVPHFLHDNNAAELHTRVNEYLRTQGLRKFTILFSGDSERAEVLQFMQVHNPDTYYMLFGQTATGHHVVVCCNDEIVHDPAMWSAAMQRPTADNLWIVWVFVPLLLVKPV